ncbi:hypothetical protein BK011_08035 [Tenericutes bacterium MZ-XQ]|nr:hypothetical protein BK011_08035 [Tenericutes bacterium MZ-XQ]
MNLVIIIGAQAVGKMTVGEELSKITNLKLFHNHMSIELALKLDNWGTPLFNEINGGIRDLVMSSFIKNKKDLIFTFTWGFELESDWEYMENIRRKFQEYKIHYVELVSDIEVRLSRNTTENRLNAKPSKRNVEWSRQEIINTNKNHRLVSNDGEIKYDNYIKINNSTLTAIEVADKIKKVFNL